MPAAIVAVGSMAAGYAASAYAVSAGIVAAGSIGATIVSGVASMVASSVLGGVLGGVLGSDEPQQQQQQQESPAATAARGMLLNTAGTVDPIPVLYGTRRVGGTRCLTEVSGADNTYIHLIIAHCEGECDGIDAVYFDNTVSTDARFAGHFTLEHFTGTDAQAACSSLVAALPAKWTTAHKLSGVAYTYARLTFNQDVWHGLPVITVDMRGRKVFDPRDSSTAWSENPAVCLRDYLTNTRYGRGIAEADIDDSTFIAAANYCDASITTPAGTQARYTCNGLVDTSKSSIENVRRLLTCMRGMLVFSGGKYKLVLDKADTAAFAFTEDNITGAWNIALGNKRGRFNRVRANWTNPDNEWQPDIALAESAAYRVIDNALMLESKIDLPFTTDAYEAQMLGQRHLKQSRFGTVASFRATIAGLGCEVGDIVSITHSTPGWSAKAFRVVRIGLMSSDEVEVTAVEYDDSVYVAEPLTTPRVSVATTLPDPFTVSAPEGLVLASGTAELLMSGDGTINSRISVTWTAPADAFVERAEVQYKQSSSSAWISPGWVSSSVARSYIIDVQDGVSYDVRVRFENSIGVRSAWTQADPHVVIGKIAPPSDVGGFLIDGTRLSWPAVTDVDLAGYRIKWQPGNSISWGDAIALHEGLITESPYTMPAPPAGAVTLMIKAVDTSGNESDSVAAIVADLGDPVVDNVIWTYDWHANAFVGTVSGGSIEPGTGDLVATIDASPLTWSDDLRAIWASDQATLMWNSSTCGAMEWIGSLLIPAADAGNQLTLVRTITADSSSIDYRVDGPGPMWSDDSALMWSADATAMWVAAPWSAWPETIVADAVTYEFRVRTIAGSTQGRVSALAAQIDVPDLGESLADVVIGSSGTRLPITGTYRAITVVSLTLQDDGGTARTIKTIDKNATLGPLVTCFDSAGNGTTGKIDALLQGY